MNRLKIGDWLLCIHTSENKTAIKGHFYQVNYIVDYYTIEMSAPLRGVWTPPGHSNSLFIHIDPAKITALERVLYEV